MTPAAQDPAAASRRLLLVHAHPDDETINCAATMAHYAAAGVHVTLVTCTLGEEGEVIGSRYAQLVSDHADQLGGYRIAELSEAMRALGITDHRFLGGAGRFRDSGMMGTDANAAPRAFWRGDTDPDVFAAAVEALVEVILQVRPQVVITYDSAGGYGHPDHIMAHRVTLAAIEQAAVPGAVHGSPWRVDKLYWTAVPHSVVAQAARDVAAAPHLGLVAVEPQDAPLGNPDSEVTTVIDAPSYLVAKTAALAAHATQVVVRDGFFGLSNLIGVPISSKEYYVLAHGEPGGPFDEHGRETDLFAGIA